MVAARTFAEFGLRHSRTWLPGALPDKLPTALVCKPRWGSASKGVVFCGPDDLAALFAHSDDLIVQDFIAGDEITVDALIDLSGRPLHCVPRRRIRTLCGESIQGVTLAVDDIGDWLVKVLTFVGELGGVGPITLQAVLSGSEPTLIRSTLNLEVVYRLRLRQGRNIQESSLTLLLEML